MTKKNPHAAALGKKGGRATSDAKKNAARENGKKGGRPLNTKNRQHADVTWDDTSNAKILGGVVYDQRTGEIVGIIFPKKPRKKDPHHANASRSD